MGAHGSSALDGPPPPDSSMHWFSRSLSGTPPADPPQQGGPRPARARAPPHALRHGQHGNPNGNPAHAATPAGTPPRAWLIGGGGVGGNCTGRDGSRRPVPGQVPTGLRDVGHALPPDAAQLRERHRASVRADSPPPWHVWAADTYETAGRDAGAADDQGGVPLSPNSIPGHRGAALPLYQGFQRPYGPQPPQGESPASPAWIDYPNTRLEAHAAVRHIAERSDQGLRGAVAQSLQEGDVWRMHRTLGMSTAAFRVHRASADLAAATADVEAARSALARHAFPAAPPVAPSSARAPATAEVEAARAALDRYVSAALLPAPARVPHSAYGVRVRAASATAGVEAATPASARRLFPGVPVSAALARVPDDIYSVVARHVSAASLRLDHLEHEADRMREDEPSDGAHMPPFERPPRSGSKRVYDSRLCTRQALCSMPSVSGACSAARFAARCMCDAKENLAVC